MTTLRDDLTDVHPARARLQILMALALTAPAFVLRFTHPEISHPLEALLFGLSIVGAAFMLSWAAEVAQLDISAGLAIALLALIAVLPEYAVDFVFARKGGESFAQTGAACLPLDGGTESPCNLALANMTGANRLLIGVGWTMVVFIAYFRLKKQGRARAGAERPLGRRAPRPGAFDRDRVPRDRDHLLAHAAAEGVDHLDRLGDPGRASSSRTRSASHAPPPRNRISSALPGISARSRRCPGDRS